MSIRGSGDASAVLKMRDVLLRAGRLLHMGFVMRGVMSCRGRGGCSTGCVSGNGKRQREQNGNYPLTVAKLNIDENPRTAQTYQILSIPTMSVFAGGKVVKQIVGAKPKAALLKELEPYLA